MAHAQITEQTAERVVYEPPLLVEVGSFADKTQGDGEFFPEGPGSRFD